MAGKSQHSDEDRARVFVCLRANNGNVKRTARDTGMHPATVRRWKLAWDEDESTHPDVSSIAAEAADFLGEAERVRDKALRELERKIPSATPSALVAMVGMLTDKVALVRGLATTRVEHTHVLPAPEDLQELVQGFVRGAIEAGSARRKEIESGEIIEGEVVSESVDKS